MQNHFALAIGLSKKIYNIPPLQGIYVVGFSFPVVPQGQARIRVQLSASHTEAQVQKLIDAFKSVQQKMGL